MKNINTNALELDSLESVVGGSQFGTKNLTIRTTGSSIGLPRYKVGQQVTVARIGATALEPGTIVGIGKGRDLFYNICWAYTIQYDNTSIPNEVVAEVYVNGDSSVPYTPSSDGGDDDHHLL